MRSPELLPEIRDGLPVTAHVVTSEVTTEILSFVPGVAVDETAAADTISRVRALPEHVPVVELDPFGDGSTVAVRIHTSAAGRRTAIFFPASVTPPAVAGSAFTDRTLYGVTFPSRGLSLVRVDTSRADAVTAMNGIGVTETCWRELSFSVEPQSSTATSGRSIASITKAVGEVLCNSLGRALAWLQTGLSHGTIRQRLRSQTSEVHTLPGERLRLFSFEEVDLETLRVPSVFL